MKASTACQRIEVGVEHDDLVLWVPWHTTQSALAWLRTYSTLLSTSFWYLMLLLFFSGAVEFVSRAGRKVDAFLEASGPRGCAACDGLR